MKTQAHVHLSGRIHVPASPRGSPFSMVLYSHGNRLAVYYHHQRTTIGPDAATPRVHILSQRPFSFLCFFFFFKACKKIFVLFLVYVCRNPSGVNLHVPQTCRSLRRPEGGVRAAKASECLQMVCVSSRVGTGQGTWVFPTEPSLHPLGFASWEEPL